MFLVLLSVFRIVCAPAIGIFTTITRIKPNHQKENEKREGSGSGGAKRKMRTTNEKRKLEDDSSFTKKNIGKG